MPEMETTTGIVVTPEFHPDEHGKYHVTISPAFHDADAGAEIRDVRSRGLGECAAHLREVRRQFFAFGSGRQLRELEARIREHDERLTAVEAERAKVLTNWQAAVELGDMTETATTEARFRQLRDEADRYRHRGAFLRDHEKKLRATLRDELEAAVRANLALFGTAVSERAAAAADQLRDVILGPWMAWLAAMSERTGWAYAMNGRQGGDRLMREVLSLDEPTPRPVAGPEPEPPKEYLPIGGDHNPEPARVDRGTSSPPHPHVLSPTP